MIRFTRNDRSLFVLALLALTTIMSLRGQENLIYNGPLTIGGYDGNAMYYYDLIKGDTILNGPFKLQRSNLGALLEKKDNTFSFKGNFQNGYPSNEWRFQFGEFQSDSLTEVVDYQYKINVNGTQQETKGSMVKGKPDGTWTFTKNKIKNSEVEETLFKSSIQFDRGMPQKSFRIENVEGTLIGRFLRDGLAHDEWTLYAKDEVDSSESWYFNNGRLLKIQKESEGKSQELPIYTKTFTNSKVINLDERYIKILKLSKIKDTSKVVAGRTPKLLAENASYYKKIDSIFSRLGKSEFLPEFKVKVPYYPLDSIERAQFDSILRYYRKSEKISSAFLGSTQLNILKLSDEQALSLYTTLDTIAKEFISPMGRLVDYHNQDILSFVPQKALLSHVWPNGFTSKEILIGLKTTPSEFSGLSIACVAQMAKHTAQTLDSIQLVLSAKLAKEKREQEFIALEEQMIVQIKNLNKLIDSANTTLPPDLLNALKNIKRVADKNLTAYSNMIEQEAKLDLGRNLVNCFDHLEQLEKAILKLPKQKKEITAAYQDQIWNPFMANLMKEDVKKRITNSYRKVWLPYLLQRVTTELDCNNVTELVNLFSKTHERMLAMREEETKRLERKLKREQDPLVIQELFNLESMSFEDQ